MSKLKVIPSEDTPSSTLQKPSLRRELEAKFEREWVHDPEQFNPLRSILERERIERTWSVVQDIQPSTVADIGCGWGVLTQRLAEKGSRVDAVDIAQSALRRLQQIENIHCRQDFVPNTTLPEELYDLVLSTELIGFLPSQLHRLYFSELARIIKTNGTVICSTAIDIYAEDALERFQMLMETEFKVDQEVLSYHALYIRLINFLKAPRRFSKASKDPEYRYKELSRKKGLSNKWFYWNTKAPLAFMWKGIDYLLTLAVNYFEQSRFILLKLEQISRFLLGDRGVSHVILIGKRRQMIETPNEEEIPVERKHRKQLWE